MRRTTVEVAVGVVAVLMLGFAVSMWVTTSLTGEPGSMSTGLGSFFAVALGLVAVVLLGWAGARIWRQDVGDRRRSLALVGVAATLAALVFGAMAVEVVREHGAEQRARAAAAPVQDIEGELADAYWAWIGEQGDSPAVMARVPGSLSRHDRGRTVVGVNGVRSAHAPTAAAERGSPPLRPRSCRSVMSAVP